jgi:hypothetical protein
MKQLLVIPIVLGLAALLGYGVLRATGVHPYSREMIAGLIPSLVAGMTALLPPLVQRRHGQGAVVQGAFHGMLIHFGMTVALAVVLVLALKLRGMALDPFVWWLMWFFAVTLIMVSTLLVRLVRTTPIVRSNLQSS